MRGVRSTSHKSARICFCRYLVFKTNRFDLIFAEESGHARFEAFASSPCFLLWFTDFDGCVHGARLQPTGARVAGFREKIRLALFRLSRVVADAQLLRAEIQ